MHRDHANGLVEWTGGRQPAREPGSAVFPVQRQHHLGRWCRRHCQHLELQQQLDDRGAPGESKRDQKKPKKKKKKKKRKSRGDDDDDDDDDDRPFVPNLDLYPDGEFADPKEDKLEILDWYKLQYDKALKKAFKLIDLDKSGTIDEDEMGIAIRALGAALTPEETRDLMMQADEDGDGKINFDEFRRCMRKRRHRDKYEEKHKSKQVFSKLIKAFRGLDIDGTGFLEEFKFRAVINVHAGVTLTKKEWIVSQGL